jgi:hypothetical protein
MLAHVRRRARRNTENRPRQPPTVIRATIHQKNKPRATTARSSHAFAFAYTLHFQAHISLRPEIEHCLSATARSSHAPATRRRPRRWSKCSTSERTWELSLFRQLDEILKIVELMRGKTLLLTFSGSHFCQPTRSSVVHEDVSQTTYHCVDTSRAPTRYMAGVHSAETGGLMKVTGH